MIEWIYNHIREVTLIYDLILIGFMTPIIIRELKNYGFKLNPFSRRKN